MRRVEGLKTWVLFKKSGNALGAFVYIQMLIKSIEWCYALVMEKEKQMLTSYDDTFRYRLVGPLELIYYLLSLMYCNVCFLSLSLSLSLSLL